MVISLHLAHEHHHVPPMPSVCVQIVFWHIKIIDEQSLFIMYYASLHYVN